MIINGKNVSFELTGIIEKLQMFQISNNLNFYYSQISKAEVFRSLRKGFDNRSNSEINQWWNVFSSILKSYHPVRTEIDINSDLSALALDFPINKNIQDYLHIIICKQNNLPFITKDKLDGKLEEIKNSYFHDIYYWPDIKDQIPVLDVFKQ